MMEKRTFIAPEYAQCKHIPREKEFLTDDELLQELTLEADVLPLFESRLRDIRNMKLSSLKRNKLLKCRLTEYLKTLTGKTRTPFYFPKQSDYHFANHLLRYKPSETIGNRENNRIHMRNGPGVDEFGQLPIPNDMFVRKFNVDN